MSTLLLSRKDIAKIVQTVGFDGLMDSMIDGLNDALQVFDPHAFSVPVRSGFSYSGDESNGLVEWMPAMRYADRVILKVVGYHPDNPQQRSLPTILSSIMTFDTQSGHAKSIIDGTFLTSLRTGAASAVASGVLAPKRSRVLGLVGAGAQAVTQLHALSRKFSFERVLIHDTDRSTCLSFSDRVFHTGFSLPIEICSLEELLPQANIICTATSMEVGIGPLFDDCELRNDVHINAVGSDFPEKTELPKQLLERSLVCPDFMEQAMLEGECQQLLANDLGPDLPTLVKQQLAYSEYREKTTVFDSTGWAFEDLIASEIITKLAETIGCGTHIDLECVADDPKNPYGFVNPITFEAELHKADRRLQA